MTSLSSQVAEAVKLARKSAGDLVVQFMLRKRLGQRHVEGRVFVDYDDKPISGLFTKFDEGEIDGTLIRSTDVKVMLFIDDAVPAYGDEIHLGKDVYEVVKPSVTYAGLKPVLCTVVVRK